MDDAFGQDEDERFTDDDWDHALGGVHFVLDVDGVDRRPTPSVVERSLQVADRPLRTGYVEAVATAPAHQGAGYGTLVMTDVDRADPRAVRARLSRHRAPRRSTSDWAGGRGGAVIGPDGRRAQPDAGRRRLPHGPRDAVVAAARPRRRRSAASGGPATSGSGAASSGRQRRRSDAHGIRAGGVNVEPTAHRSPVVGHRRRGGVEDVHDVGRLLGARAMRPALRDRRRPSRPRHAPRRCRGSPA